MTPAEVLLKAAKLIEKRGWWQGEYEGPGGCLCVMGAIHVAVGRDADDDSGYPRRPNGEYGAIAAMELLLGEPILHFWNDEDGRTQAEVTAALRAAAVSA